MYFVVSVLVKNRGHMHLQCGWSQEESSTSPKQQELNALPTEGDDSTRESARERKKESVRERAFLSQEGQTKQARPMQLGVLWLVGLLSKHYALYSSTAQTSHHKAPCVILCLCVYILWISLFIFYIARYYSILYSILFSIHIPTCTLRELLIAIVIPPVQSSFCVKLYFYVYLKLI